MQKAFSIGARNEETPDDQNRVSIVIIMEPGGECLFLRRAAHKLHGGRWGLVGGKAKQGEHSRTTAAWESYEECGYFPGRIVHVHSMRTSMGREMEAYLCFADSKFKPRLNGEHDRYAWADLRGSLIGDMIGNMELINAVGIENLLAMNERRDDYELLAPLMPELKLAAAA